MLVAWARCAVQVAIAGKHRHDLWSLWALDFVAIAVRLAFESAWRLCLQRS
jgi:hypothetical protein